MQVNREMLRRDRDNMVKKRLELEARSGLVRDPALLSQYGIDLNEVQKSKVPRPPNHNANHLYRAATGASKLAEQYLRRHDELEKVRARHRSFHPLVLWLPSSPPHSLARWFARLDPRLLPLHCDLPQRTPPPFASRENA